MKHIRAGRAECVGTVTEPVGVTHQIYWVINRFDKQRTDHVKLGVVGRHWRVPLLGKNGYAGSADA